MKTVNQILINAHQYFLLFIARLKSTVRLPINVLSISYCSSLFNRGLFFEILNFLFAILE